MAVSHYPLRELDWDTQLFETKIGELVLEADSVDWDFSSETWDATLMFARTLGYTFLLCQFDAKHQALCHEIIAHGATLGDVLVTLRLDLTSFVPGKNGSAHTIEVAQQSDLPEVTRISEASFHYSRFFQDRRFDANKVKQFYPAWITNSFGVTEQMVVLRMDSQIGGFISYQDLPESDTVVIRLVAVNDALRGQGLGQALIEWMIGQTQTMGRRFIQVGTQINNYSALRLYQKNGFLIQNARYRWHVWLEKQARGMRHEV